MRPQATLRQKSRPKQRWLLIASLTIGLLCSAGSVLFEGETASSILQLCGIAVPFIVGALLAGPDFLQMRFWRESPEVGALLIAFIAAAGASSVLSAFAQYDPYPILFLFALAGAFVVYGGLWSLDEESIWTALRIYCVLATILIFFTWIVKRHPGERFIELMQPNMWGLLCFTNFCLSSLIRRAIFRLPIQIANVLVILDAQSRSALLSTIVAASVLVYFAAQTSRLRKEEKLFLGVLAVAACSVLALVFREQGMRMLSTAFMLDDPHRGTTSGFSGRTELWEAGLRVFETNPLFGVGPRMESNYINGTIQYAHSGYISTLVDYGIVGATLFFGMAAMRVRGVWAMAVRRRTGAITAAALVLGFAAEAVFEPKLINIGNPASLLLFAFLFMPKVPSAGREPVKPVAAMAPLPQRTGVAAGYQA